MVNPIKAIKLVHAILGTLSEEFEGQSGDMHAVLQMCYTKFLSELKSKAGTCEDCDRGDDCKMRVKLQDKGTEEKQCAMIKEIVKSLLVDCKFNCGVTLDLNDLVEINNKATEITKHKNEALKEIMPELKKQLSSFMGGMIGDLEKQLGVDMSEKEKPLQIEFCKNWDMKLPVSGLFEGKEITLLPSEEKDLLVSKEKLPVGAFITGGQVQLKDDQDNQYWAYYYKKHECEEHPLIIDKIRRKK